MKDGLTDARRRANDIFDQTEVVYISAREKEQKAQDAKIARLRALRLAKEATEKAADSSMKHSKRGRKTV
jgi:hypothetical protein